MELSKSLKPVLRLPFRCKNINVRPKSALIVRRYASTSSSQPSSGVFSSGSNSAASNDSRTANIASLISTMRSAPPRYSRSQVELDPNDKNAPLHSFPQEAQPWHFHVYSTKHNTHLTLSRPNRKSVISISTGNIGFRKSQRGSYDAGYQLGAYMMARINRAGLLNEIDQMELVLRGFGNGREALNKILCGTEGSALRPKISRVTDATRLKFGGTRSKKPRRLG